MQMNDDDCPVCLNANGGTCVQWTTQKDTTGFDCKVCGKFEITRSALISYFAPDTSKLTSIQRAILSHRLLTTATTSKLPVMTVDWLEQIDDMKLPSPAIQAINTIRYIGDEINRTGQPINNLPLNLYAIAGSANPYLFGQIIRELIVRGDLLGTDVSTNQGSDFLNVGLALNGWEKYELEQQGKVAGKSGFIAMKFGDTTLDPFIQDIVKPAILQAIGYELIDLRNVTRAGIIDNIMRTEIRDAAFVIVDLTHDNSGAYWEAGYAEGLGKPVVYICEQSKFDSTQTHFDTNHCTTVMWSLENGEEFTRELIATLRRSLNLF